MRVLEVLPSISSEAGGPSRSTLSNCRAVRRMDSGVRFTLATTAQGLDPSWRTSFEARMPPGMRLVVFPAVGQGAFSFSPALAKWLHRNTAHYDLLVVRALLHPISSTAAWIARQQDVPYVVVPHGTLSRYTFTHRRTLLKRAYYQLLERRTLAGAEAVRFTCRAERDQSPSLDAGTRVCVIPHPYEPQYTPGGWTRTRDSQILFLSRLDPKKGLDLVLQAMPDVAREAPAAGLVVAGSGRPAFERRLHNQIRRLDLQNVVALPGFVEGDDKTRLLCESGVFVLPSRQENFGLAVVEAMDAGLPVVISRGVGIWPEVQAAGAGIVVDRPTPEKLARALLRLLRDKALREEMGRAGRQLVERAFVTESVGRRLRDLYRAAAGFPEEVRGLAS